MGTTWRMELSLSVYETGKLARLIEPERSRLAL